MDNKKIAIRIAIITGSLIVATIAGISIFNYSRILGKKKIEDVGADIYVDE
jgi:hypothetical protein